MHVLVTGATGFVGTALCRRLVDRGFAVTAVGRRAAVPVDEAEATAIRPAVREIGPDTDWSDLLSGVDAVVHLAALVHCGAGEAHASAYHAVNAEGTENLAEQAARAGVRRFIFVSTVKVHGERSTGRPLREEDPAAPVDPYAASKWAAEQAIRRIVQERALEGVVIRPPLVYGPGVRANFLRLLEAVSRGTPLPVASVRNRRSMVYVGNLVSALERSLVDAKAAGETFLVCDGPAVSTAELVRAIAVALDRPARLLPVPPVLLRIAGGLAGRSATVHRLVGSMELDAGRIARRLGWHPPFTMEQGLRETAQWFRARRTPAS